MTNTHPKRRAHWAAYLWPGLAHLWVRGSLAGLVLAVGFTVLVNMLVLSVFVWPEWLAPRVELGCAISAAVIWVAALIETRGELRRIADHKEHTADSQETDPYVPPELRKADALLRLAQRSYLRADWPEAQRLLRSVLKIDKEDIEAQLLLAGVHRRMGRAADAKRRLKRLFTRDGADRWHPEIEREIRLLDRPAEPEQYEEPPRQSA